MFAGFFQDVFRMLWWVLLAWWNLMTISIESIWTLKIQRNPMIPNYLMIPAAAIWWSPGIRWSPVIRWSPDIRWSIRSMDFDNRKVYGDTSITDGLVLPNQSFLCLTLHGQLYSFFWAADSKIRHLSTTYNHFVIAIAKEKQGRAGSRRGCLRM